MRFVPCPLHGAFLIEVEPHCDERGFFARGWCEREFRKHGIDHQLVQCDISYNRHAGTLRGMHYQLASDAETKIVRCIKGALWDVILDLRKDIHKALAEVHVLQGQSDSALYYYQVAMQETADAQYQAHYLEKMGEVYLQQKTIPPRSAIMSKHCKSTKKRKMPKVSPPYTTTWGSCT
ncbi:MAG: dTDP-4-keto-6-deoxy-D-glucose epimerase [Blastochloris sp.]|nr:dTDP-4-keto-6-deoxy-D-glucose epimerase [Blastochloris sp.]